MAKDEERALSAQEQAILDQRHLCDQDHRAAHRRMAEEGWVALMRARQDGSSTTRWILPRPGMESTPRASTVSMHGT